MKKDENENIRRHLEYTMDLMHKLIKEVKDVEFENFKHQSQLKDMIFSQLLELGEASKEIVDVTDTEDLNRIQRDVFQRLSLLRNARNNYETEVTIKQVWNIVKFDLPEMEEELLVNN